MKSDIEIAREANMQPIQTVAEKLDITADELDLYGKYKAKLTDELWERIKDRPDGKLVLVTAINPTPAGEGKTTTTVGLGQAMDKIGKKAIIALREPSLGPCFGLKGGAAGGGGQGHGACVVDGVGGAVLGHGAVVGVVAPDAIVIVVLSPGHIGGDKAGGAGGVIRV